MPHGSLSFFFYILRLRVSHNFSYPTSNIYSGHFYSSRAFSFPCPGGDAASYPDEQAALNYITFFHWVMKWDSSYSEVFLRRWPNTFPRWDICTQGDEARSPFKLYSPSRVLPGTQDCEICSTAQTHSETICRLEKPQVHSVVTELSWHQTETMT